jgi:hypothetical protein
VPVPLAIALIVFSLGLVGMAALHLLTTQSPAASDARPGPGFEESFDALLTGMALVSVLLMILGIFGLFSVGSFGVGVALCGIAGWWWKSYSREIAHTDRSGALLLPVGLLIVTLAAVGMFSLVRPYEAYLNSDDATLYLGAAAHLADGGGFVNDDPLVAEMTPDERAQFFAGALFRTDRPGAYYHRFPGGVQLLDPAGSAVSFNFYHLWPAWLALGWKTMGSPGFLGILSIFVAMSAIALFLVGRLLGGAVFAMACVAVLFATFPQLHYSRMPLSELPAQAFFLVGLWCFLRAMRSSGLEQRNQRILAGTLWGCMCLSRADGALLLYPALCAGRADGTGDPPPGGGQRVFDAVRQLGSDRRNRPGAGAGNSRSRACDRDRMASADCRSRGAGIAIARAAHRGDAVRKWHLRPRDRGVVPGVSRFGAG